MAKLEEILREVLKVKEVHDGMNPGNTKTWDSFNALIIVAKIEEAYDTSFSMEEVNSVKSVFDIRQAIRNHMEKKDEETKD